MITTTVILFGKAKKKKPFYYLSEPDKRIRTTETRRRVMLPTPLLHINRDYNIISIPAQRDDLLLPHYYYKTYRQILIGACTY